MQVSLDERDYIYDPKEFRGKLQRRSKSSNLVVSILIWVLVGVVLTLAFRSYQEHHQGGGQMKFGLNSPLGFQCEALPPNGNINVLDPSIGRRSDAIYSGFKFDSELTKPVVLVISNPERNVQYQAVAVYPRQSAQVNLPVGSYGMTILAGDKWCNVKVGFVNGTRVSINPAVEVKAGYTGSMLLRPEVAGHSDLMVSYQSLADQLAEKMPKQVFGNGYMDLRRDQGGNYKVLGRVNGAQVEFMVDTGASITSINQQTGLQAGIQQCTPREFHTANGKVMGCVGTANQLVFGNFSMENIEVAILPQLETSALLGMNALSRVHIEQHGQVMRVSAQ